MQRYNGKIIVITGGSAGLGRAMAFGFAQEGAHVAVLGTDEGRTRGVAAEIVAGGGKATPFLTDVGDETQVRSTFARIVDTLGGIDVLVNNAAFAYGDIFSLLRITQNRLDTVMRVNVYGPIFCIRAAHASMRQRPGSNILNISSVSSYMPSGAYSLSKAALNNVTLAMAAELAADQVRVNGIAPGRMASPNAETLPGAMKDAFLRAQLVKRPGEERDVVTMALFLASAEAGFVSGQTIAVDGGFLSHGAKASVSMPSQD